MSFKSYSIRFVVFGKVSLIKAFNLYYVNITSYCIFYLKRKMKAYFSTSTFYWLPTWRVLSRHLLTAVLIINLLGIFIYLTSTTSSYSTHIVIESCVLSNQSLNSSTSSKPTKEDNASGISLSPKIDIGKYYHI